jgi:hypothetical protein
LGLGVGLPALPNAAFERGCSLVAPHRVVAPGPRRKQGAAVPTFEKQWFPIGPADACSPMTCLKPNLLCLSNQSDLVLNVHSLLSLAIAAQDTTTAMSGGTAKRHAPHCPPKIAVSTPLHLPLSPSTRLDEISLPPAPSCPKRSIFWPIWPSW